MTLADRVHLAGRGQLGPYKNPWCSAAWSKCGGPAIQGLGAKWPSRFSDERFSDRAEGEVRGVAALTHGFLHSLRLGTEYL
jgi:hypothetical protein